MRAILTRLYAGYTAVSQRLALLLTQGVSMMECAYIFAFLAIMGFPGFSATPAQLIQWISQTFIQLVMLSVISVAQRLMQQQADTHHQEVQALHEQHAAAISALHASHMDLHAKVDALSAQKDVTP